MQQAMLRHAMVKTEVLSWLAQLEMESVLRDFTRSKQRLLVLGYNATLTTAVEAPRQPKRHFDQIQVGSPSLISS